MEVPPTSPALISLSLAVLSYLWGSLLPAEWVAWRKLGRTLQDVGENPGASATWRLLGAKAGLFVLTFDLLKGGGPYLLAVAMQLQGLWLVLPSLAPVIGHNWPLGRPRRGGHGLAAAGGVILSAGWPVMVYSALVSAVPAVLWFRRQWGVALAAVGIPLGVAFMLSASYPADAVAVVAAVTGAMAVRLAMGRRAAPEMTRD
jgi:glycerol-3-phosphate acyltransferase PlsY